jgi:hypothetical protein
MLVAMLFVPAMASPCPEISTLAGAAHGGWLLEPQRACLHMGLRRKQDRADASRLLLADALARSDNQTWTTLALEHLEHTPEDGDVWMKLVLDTHRSGTPTAVVALVNRALRHKTAWATPGEDPRLASMLRLRMYAAVEARRGLGIDETVAQYAQEWRQVALELPPAVAWQGATDSPY